MYKHVKSSLWGKPQALMSLNPTQRSAQQRLPRWFLQAEEGGTPEHHALKRGNKKPPALRTAQALATPLPLQVGSIPDCHTHNPIKEL